MTHRIALLFLFLSTGCTVDTQGDADSNQTEASDSNASTEAGDPETGSGNAVAPGDDPGLAATDLNENDTDASPTPPPSCDGEASYRVTFDVTWTETNFPTDYPVEGPDVPTYDAAHLSPLIGAAHGDSWAPWRAQEAASDGTEIMAESGNPATLAEEVQAAIEAGNAASLIRGSGVGYPPAQDGASFTVSTEFPQATVSSMLAPSPDWFAGAHVHLCGDNGWVAELAVDAVVHDAGTDDGSGYNYGWQDTQPPAPIAPITEHLFETNNVVGSFTFVKQ